MQNPQTNVSPEHIVSPVRPLKTQRLWHYTHGLAIDEILASGVIQLVGHSGLYPVLPEERVVWFSANQQWELTVRKTHLQLGHDMTFVELHQTYGCYRIGINHSLDLIRWKDYLNRFPKLKPLAKAGKHWGANPIEWYVSKPTVGRDRWQGVQVFNGHGWVDYAGVSDASPILVSTGGAL